MFLTPVWSRYLQSSPITLGSYLWGRCGDGLGELWRGAKVLLRRLASPQILFYCTLYVQLRSSLWQIPGVIAQLSHRQLACLILRTEYIGRICAPREAMARWQAAQVSDHHAHPTVYAVFQIFITGSARFLRQTDVKPLGYLGAFVGCGRDVFRHWSSYLGRIT